MMFFLFLIEDELSLSAHYRKAPNTLAARVKLCVYVVKMPKLFTRVSVVLTTVVSPTHHPPSPPQSLVPDRQYTAK